MRFPWKENHPFLPSNFSICDRQTRALARRLARQPDLLRLYDQLISDQEQRNFVEQAPNQNAMEYITPPTIPYERTLQPLLSGLYIIAVAVNHRSMLI